MVSDGVNSPDLLRPQLNKKADLQDGFFLNGPD